MDTDGFQSIARAWPGSTLGFVLAYSGAIKLKAGPWGLRGTLNAIPHIPAAAAAPMARLLPLVEIAIGIGLLFGFFAAKAAALVLLAGFLIISVTVIRRKYRVPCNCFGDTNGRVISWATVRLNAALAGMAAGSLLLAQGSLTTGGAFVSIATIAGFLCFAQLLGNRRKIRQLRTLSVLPGGPRW